MPGRNWWNERVGLRERLLDEVLGVRGVAGHPHRGRVELVEERQRVALEAELALGLGLGLQVDLGRVVGGLDRVDGLGLVVAHHVPA